MAATPNLVHHVHAVVLAVRARDAEEEREPAQEAELPLALERALEDKLVPLATEVAARLLRHPVQEDLESLPGRRG